MPTPQCSILQGCSVLSILRSLAGAYPLHPEDVREKYMAKFGEAAQSASAYAHSGEFSQVHLSQAHVSPACMCGYPACAAILAKLRHAVLHAPLCLCMCATANANFHYLGAGGEHGVL